MLPTTGEYVLLETVDKLQNRRVCGRNDKKFWLIPAAVVATLLLALLGGFSIITTHPSQHRPSLMPRNIVGQGERSVWDNTSAISLTAGYDDGCWIDTGGTCNVHDCDSYRKATCTWSGVFRLCTCPGQCVGSDYACHTERNQLVAEHVTFKNKQYDYYMYAPKVFLTMKIGQDYNRHFKVHKVPGNRSLYMISPEAYPDRVLSMSVNVQLGGLSAWAVHDAKPDSYLSRATGDSASPEYVFWVMCRKNSGEIQMGIDWFAKKDYVWAYNHYFSYFVFGWVQGAWGVPDERAVWLTEGTFADKLDPCPR